MNQTVSRRTAGYIRSLNCRLTVEGIRVRPSESAENSTVTPNSGWAGRPLQQRI